MTTAVVYVHGLWMVGLEGILLRHRLAGALHARVPFFWYRSVGASLSSNAQRLANYLSKLEVDTLHLVGHSLGGLVILKLFEQGNGAMLPPGRVVLLGSPVGGSRAAQTVAKWKIGPRILGRSLMDTVCPSWRQARELGVIAGDLNIGLGRIVNTHDAPSDGTVYVDETRIAGAKDNLVLKVSHTGLPFSRLVADQATRFLSEGRFLKQVSP